MKTITEYLPPEVAAALIKLPSGALERLEEIRFRMGREVTALTAGREVPLSFSPVLMTTESMINQLVNRCCAYSPYALEEQLRQGFLPLKGGHRLGLCGTVVMAGQDVVTLKNLSSANFRIARECKGCGDILAGNLEKTGENLLIFGPPASGKTTLLRDCIRQISDGGQRISLVDSRGEIAACVDGRPQLDVGRCTDILSLGEKGASMELLLRVMNPTWLAVDEITATADIQAMVQASYCGVSILATAHGHSMEDLRRRPLYHQLLETEIFKQIALVNRDKQVKIERIGDVC
ncbi:MAG: ATPase, T2SS/T4P/T4SS family [Eubacteriales bacterium]